MSPSFLIKIPVAHGGFSPSLHMLNIRQNINPLYQMLQPLQDMIATSKDEF